MIWKVLKNRSNEIHSNEIRIRRELPVYDYHSENNFGKQNYIKTAISDHVVFSNLYLLTVLLSIPLNKLPWQWLRTSDWFSLLLALKSRPWLANLSLQFSFKLVISGNNRPLSGVLCFFVCLLIRAQWRKHF